MKIKFYSFIFLLVAVLQSYQLNPKDKFSTVLYVQNGDICSDCIFQLKNHFYKYPKNFEIFLSTKSWVESYFISSAQNLQTYHVIIKQPFVKKSEGMYFDTNLNSFHLPFNGKLPSFDFENVLTKKDIAELNQILNLELTQHLLHIAWTKMFGWELTYNFGLVLIGRKNFIKKISKLEKILEEKCCDELNRVILDLRYDKGYVIKKLDV